MRTLFVCFTLLFWETLGTSADRECTIGYCPQADALIEHLTGRQSLDILAALHGYSHPMNETIIVSTGVGMQEHSNRPTGKYSGGQCHKISVAASFFAQNSFIILEPTAGIDPITRRDDWSVICALKENTNTAVVLTSQSMDEVESLVSNLIILREIVMERSPQLIKNKFGDHCNFNLVPEAATDVAEITTKVTAAFSGAILYDSASLKNIKYRIPRHHSDVFSTLFEKAASIAEQIKVTDFSFTQATLEDSFILAFTLQPVMQSPPFGQQLLGQPQHFYPRKVTDIVITCVGMHEHAHRATGRYSGGQRCKISVAASLFAQNSLIILDEPTAGIDPIARRYVWSVYCALRENINTAFLLTSHSMDEVEALVSNLITLSQGSIVVEGSQQVFKNQFGDHYKHMKVDPGSEMNVGEIPNLPIGVFFILEGFIEILINAFFGCFLVCFFDRFLRRRRTESLILLIYFPAPVHSAQPTVSNARAFYGWKVFAIAFAVMLAILFLAALIYLLLRRRFRKSERTVTVFPRLHAGGNEPACKKPRCEPLKSEFIKCSGGRIRHSPCYECFKTYRLWNRSTLKCPKNNCPGTLSVWIVRQAGLQQVNDHLDALVDLFDRMTLLICSSLGIAPSVNEEFPVMRPVPYKTRVPSGETTEGPILKCTNFDSMDVEYLNSKTITRESGQLLHCPAIKNKKPCGGLIFDRDYKALRIIDDSLKAVP